MTAPLDLARRRRCAWLRVSTPSLRCARRLSIASGAATPTTRTFMQIAKHGLSGGAFVNEVDGNR